MAKKAIPKKEPKAKKEAAKAPIKPKAKPEKITVIKPAAEATAVQRVLSVIGYLWILNIMALLAKRNKEFLDNHAKQGFLLFVSETIFGALFFVVLPFILPRPVSQNEALALTVSIIWIITGILLLLTLIAAIVGIVRAVIGKKYRVPILWKIWK